MKNLVRLLIPFCVKLDSKRVTAKSPSKMPDAKSQPLTGPAYLLIGALIVLVGAGCNIDDRIKGNLNLASEKVTLTVTNSHNFSIPENVASQFVLTLSLPVPIDTPITWVIETSNGQSAASDFSAVSGSATILTDMPSVSISVPIIDDSELEENETFRFRITSVPKYVGLAKPFTAFTILDNESLGKSTLRLTSGGIQNATTPGGLKVNASVGSLKGVSATTSGGYKVKVSFLGISTD